MTSQEAGEATTEMIGDDAIGVLASTADEAHAAETKGPTATSTGDVMGEATSDAILAQAAIANDMGGEMAELGTAKEEIAERAVAPLTDESSAAASRGADESVAKDDLVAEPTAEHVAELELPGAHANGV
jgi:hypothetical protein